MERQTFTMQPIGRTGQSGDSFILEIEERFRPGLTGLDEFSHLMVIWAFDRVAWDGGTLVTPPPYRRLTHDQGIFATRGPFRPNPIAVSVCRILSVDLSSGRLAVDWIDAEENSAVLDIKPYHPSSDSVSEIVMPFWCSHWPKSREASGDFDWESEFTFG